MPSFSYMMAKAFHSKILGIALLIAGLVMTHTCVLVLRDWALPRPRHIPAMILLILANLGLAAFGGWIIYNAFWK